MALKITSLREQGDITDDKMDLSPTALELFRHGIFRLVRPNFASKMYVSHDGRLHCFHRDSSFSTQVELLRNLLIFPVVIISWTGSISRNCLIDQCDVSSKPGIKMDFIQP